MQNQHSMRRWLVIAWKRTRVALSFLLTMTDIVYGQGSFQEIGPITDSIDDFIDKKPSVAMDGSGNHVVAWTSVGTEPFAAFFRLTNTTGDIISLPVQASPYPEHFVSGSPSVAMDSNGNFVVAWTKVGSSPFAVFHRRYNASGTLHGDVIQVSLPEHFVTSSPSVAMDASGDFVVTWTKVGSSPFAVFYQLYNAEGTPNGDATRVSPSEHFVTSSPSVAMDASGNFVVTWTKVGSSPFAVFMQRYFIDVNGVPQAQGVIRVSPEEHFVTAPPTVAMSDDGSFAIAWNEVGTTFDAFVQLYTANATPVDSAIAANEGGFITDNSDPGEEPDAPVSVAMDTDGSFIVAWTDVGSEFSVFARRFDNNGAPADSQFRVSPEGEFINIPPSVTASSGNTTHAIAWTDGSSFQTVHKLFVDDATATPQTKGSLKNFSLGQNYPNPFNPSTKIKYSIPKQSYITLTVFDIIGVEIETLVNEEKPVGIYEVNFNASNLSSGIYFYRLQAGDFIQTRKMILLK